MTEARTPTPIDGIAEAWVDALARLSPTTATYIGRTEYNGQYGDYSPTGAEAFADAEHSAPPVEVDGAPGEATLVCWLRESDAYEARFALVASSGDAPVGYAVATWGDVDGAAVLGIGPIAVTPTFQGRGVGAALVRELLRRATERGERVVVLQGDPDYYARFGFVPASHFGIAADPAWGAYFQACALGDEHDVPSGTYTYAEPFARLG